MELGRIRNCASNDGSGQNLTDPDPSLKTCGSGSETKISTIVRVKTYLRPGHEGEEQKEDTGGQLSAGQQGLGFLPELQVNQKDCHSPSLFLFFSQKSKKKKNGIKLCTENLLVRRILKSTKRWTFIFPQSTGPSHRIQESSSFKKKYKGSYRCQHRYPLSSIRYRLQKLLIDCRNNYYRIFSIFVETSKFQNSMVPYPTKDKLYIQRLFEFLSCRQCKPCRHQPVPCSYLRPDLGISISYTFLTLDPGSRMEKFGSGPG